MNLSRWFRRAPPDRPPPPNALSPPQERAPPDRWNLDTPLVALSPWDNWTIRDACEGVQIFGAIGSGKTSGSGATIAKAFLRAGMGGIVMCAKPEERQLWEGYARECGREKHLVIFSPDHPYRFNFLDYELKRGGSGGGLTENIVGLLSQVVELAEGKVEQSGDGAFWTRAMRELLRNSVDLLAISHGTISLEAIMRLIADAPQSSAEAEKILAETEVESPENFCARCLKLADEKEKSAREAHDLEMAATYWLKLYPGMADKTRAGVVSTFTGVADTLLHGIAWALLATDTTIVPDVTWRDGAIIILDLPIQEYGEVGRICQGIVKFMWQKAVLRRDVNQYPRPVFLWADEAQNFVSSFDFQYQSVARSARACTVYMTQNISNYYAVLGRGSRDAANSLLGLFQTVIWHANGDAVTNVWASERLSQEKTTNFSFNAGTSQSGASQSTGGSEAVRPKLLPAEFTTLKKGGPANNFQVEGIGFQGGRIWKATNDSYIRCVFRQK